MRALFCETTQDLVNDGIAIRTRLHCGKSQGAPCPDELRPTDPKNKATYSAKDFGMYRHLSTSEYAQQTIIPAMEFVEVTPFRTMEKEALEEFWIKVTDHAMIEYDEEILNQWWDLLHQLGGLKSSWHGDAEEMWSEAKRKYLTDHLIEAKRAELHGSTVMPTEYMVKNLPEELRRPFAMSFESPKDMRPGRVVHPGSRPSEKKYAPPPPPKYHNWGTWGS